MRDQLCVVLEKTGTYPAVQVLQANPREITLVQFPNLGLEEQTRGSWGIIETRPHIPYGNISKRGDFLDLITRRHGCTSPMGRLTQVNYQFCSTCE